MLKKIIIVSIISLLGFNAFLDAGTMTPMSNVGFFSKTMQKAGETRFIFGVGGGFDYLTKSKFSTSQVRYAQISMMASKDDIINAIKDDWSEGPLFTPYRTKYKYQIYPEIELGLRYMPKDQYYIQVTGNWQFINKKLQFANLKETKVINTSNVGAKFMEYTKEFLLAHPEVKDYINPLNNVVVAYVEGADADKIIKLRSRGNINFSAGKFLNKTLCVGIDLGISMHGFKINYSGKTAIGFIAGVNFEHFFNSRISLLGYTNYTFNTKKISDTRNTIRGINFGGRVRCYF